MGSVNRTIIVSVIIIMAAGAYKLFLGKNKYQPGALTKVLVGGYLLALFASFFELLGFGIGQIVGDVLLLAAGAALFYIVVDDLYSRYVQSLGGFTGAGGSSTKR